MVREDILSGLQNAIERGDSIEEAARSFVNSGYTKAEVQEAVSFLNKGAISQLEKPKQTSGLIYEEKKLLIKPKQKPQIKEPLKEQFSESPPTPSQKLKEPIRQFKPRYNKKVIWTIVAIILGIIFLLLLILLGVTIFFRESIISFISAYLT